MEPKIKNWEEQDELFELDYCSVKATMGNYRFDIRYDCDQMDSKKRPGNNCGVCLTIYYKHKGSIHSAFAHTVEGAKKKAEKWLLEEVAGFFSDFSELYTMDELRKVVHF